MRDLSIATSTILVGMAFAVGYLLRNLVPEPS